MVNYFIGFFHIAIIAIFLGCGYKAPPKWSEDTNSTKTIKTKEVKVNID
ncbi:hypothetical protein [Caminibacter sp.]